MTNNKLLTELRQMEQELLTSKEPSAYIRLHKLIEEVEGEIRDECNRDAGKGSVAKAAQRILKIAQGQYREALWKAYRGKDAVIICDGFRAVRFNLDTAPSLEEHPEEFYDYPDIGRIVDDQKKANDVPVNVPSLGELRAFIKTEKARLKAKKEKGVRLILQTAGQEVHVDAKYLLDMLEALPGATVTASKRKTQTTALYFIAENGDGVLFPLRPLKN